MSYKDLAFVILWECDEPACKSFVARSNQYMYLPGVDDHYVFSFVYRHYREDHPEADLPPEDSLI